MIACLQFTSSDDVSDNLKRLEGWLEQLPTARPLLLCLPEAFACFDAPSNVQHALGLGEAHEKLHSKLASLAKQFGIWLSAGTIPVSEGDKYFAASFLFNEQGEEVARYDKIHLFDVDVADATANYRESASTHPGQNLVVVDSPFGRIGLSVCYDVRFPGLFQKLTQMGAEIILLPSAFTVPTGEAHWHTLLRARAIENQVYLVAPAMVGEHARGRKTYGHSLIVDPWGEIVAELAQQQGLLVYLPNREMVANVRAKMPLQQHNKFTYEFKP